MTEQRKGAPVVLIVLVAILVAIIVGVFLLVTSSQPSQEAVQQQAAQTPTQAQVAADLAAQEAAQNTPKALWESGAIRSVRLVGDSITAGFGTDGYEDPDYDNERPIIYDDGEGEVHRETSTTAQSWANAFRAHAAERGITNFVNAGINGFFMQQFADNPDAWLGEGADLVVVALGTNDAGYYGPQEFRAAAETALAAAAAKSRCVVVLSPVSDLRPDYQLVEPAAALGDVLHALCEQQGYVFVDTRDAVTPQMFCEDGLHPNTQGSMAIWECLRTQLGI